MPIRNDARVERRVADLTSPDHADLRRTFCHLRMDSAGMTIEAVAKAMKITNNRAYELSKACLRLGEIPQGWQVHGAQAHVQSMRDRILTLVLGGETADTIAHSRHMRLRDVQAIIDGDMRHETSRKKRIERMKEQRAMAERAPARPPPICRIEAPAPTPRPVFRVASASPSGCKFPDWRRPCTARRVPGEDFCAEHGKQHYRLMTPLDVIPEHKRISWRDTD